MAITSSSKVFKTSSNLPSLCCWAHWSRGWPNIANRMVKVYLHTVVCLLHVSCFLLTSRDMGMLSYVHYFFIVGMFFTAVIQTMVLHQYFHRCFTTGMRLRAALVTAIYRKTLVLSNGSRQQSTVGEVSIENGWMRYNQHVRLIFYKKDRESHERWRTTIDGSLHLFPYW